MSNNTKPVVIAGAGLAGCLLGVYLSKAGFSVAIYEKRTDMRKQQISAGRSINLAMSVRGFHALREVGLADSIMEIAIPMKGRKIHSPKGELSYHPYSHDEKECIYSVSRAELNKKLMSLAEQHSGIKIQFEHECSGLDFQKKEIKFSLLNNGTPTSDSKTVQAQAIIGCDGAFSAVRREHFKVPTMFFNYSQTFLKHGYKELTIPPDANGKHRMEINYLHIWPRGTYMMIALPNIDGSFTCTLFFPFEGEYSFQTINTPEKVLAFFNQQFPDAVPLMPTLVEDYFNNPTAGLVTVQCWPWSVDGAATLLGDAAHAMVPFFGQGMNCAFEDCSVLNQCVESYFKEGGWGAVLREYQARRKVNTDAIQDMAIENFYEMRDKVADERFLLRKKIEHLLETNFPGKFISRYEMVSFSRIPYSEAYSIGLLNDQVLEELMQGIKDVSEVDLNKAKSLIETRLSSANKAAFIKSRQESRARL